MSLYPSAVLGLTHLLIMSSAGSRSFGEERPPSKLKVAGVVVFYMVSALVVRSIYLILLSDVLV